ncbi:MAG: hypothetical protein ABIJ28_00330 [Patescibacteria group bacterium]|nr:hypothetical protein [Patescibacteria group bacterium]
MNFEKFGITPITPEKNPEYRKRLESWNKIEKNLDESTRDEFDNPEEFPQEFIEGGNIDEKIKELVVGLNIIGIDTRFSCEGHFKGVLRTTAKGQIDNYGKWHREEIENPPLEGAWNNPYVGFLLGVYPFLARTKKERQIREEKERKIIATIQSLIDEYYQEREGLPEVRVRIKKAESRYSDYLITASDAEDTEAISGTEDYDSLKQGATERLESEQQEIIGFSEFIKKKYLETGFHL